MTDMQIAVLFVIGLLVVAGIYMRVKSFPKCAKCGGELKLESIRDPVGFNISKRLTLSFYKGPRKYKEELMCPACGNKQELD